MAFWPSLLKCVPDIVSLISSIFTSKKDENKATHVDATASLVERVGKPLGESAGNYVDGKITETKTFISEKMAESMSYIDNVIGRLDKSVGEKIADAKAYIDAKSVETRTYVDGKITEVERYIDNKSAEAQAFVAAESRALTRRLLWIALGALLLQTAAIVGALMIFR